MLSGFQFIAIDLLSDALNESGYKVIVLNGHASNMIITPDGVILPLDIAQSANATSRGE